MGYALGTRSRSNLRGVHPDLVDVVELAISITTQDFSVLEGVRTEARQRQLVASGASRTMKSRHLTGHAVDLAPYPLSWHWPLFFPIADAMIRAAAQLDTPLRWGGNWRFTDLREYDEYSAKEINQLYDGNFPDGPHFELPAAFY